MGNSSIARVLWDSCVFIELLQSGQDASRDPHKRHEDVRHIYEQAREQKVEIWGSMVAISECLGRRHEKDLDHIDNEEVESFLRREEFFFRQVDREVAELSRRLRREFHPLDLWDAIHAATAILSGSTLLTYDGDGKDRDKKLLGLNGKMDGLRIITPHEFVHQDLTLFQKAGRD